MSYKAAKYKNEIDNKFSMCAILYITVISIIKQTLIALSMKSPTNSGKSSKQRISSAQPRPSISSSPAAFANNLQKYMALHARSKQILEQMHVPRAGTAGTGKRTSGNGTPKGELKSVTA